MIVLIISVILMTLMGAVGSLFFKKASACEMHHILEDKNLYIGGILYFLSLILNIYLLAKLDYSLVVPLCSLAYIWTMILSCTILKEKITYRKIIGTIIMIFGILLLI